MELRGRRLQNSRGTSTATRSSSVKSSRKLAFEKEDRKEESTVVSGRIESGERASERMIVGRDGVGEGRDREGKRGTEGVTGAARKIIMPQSAKPVM